MTIVYFRRPNGSVGKFNMESGNVYLARSAALVDLADFYGQVPSAVLAVVESEGWDGL